MQALGEDAERPDLAVLIADLSAYCECLPEMADGVLVFALANADLAEGAQRDGYADPAVDAVKDGQGGFEVGGSLGQLAATQMALTDRMQRRAFTRLALHLAEHVQGMLLRESRSGSLGLWLGEDDQVTIKVADPDLAVPGATPLPVGCPGSPMVP